MHKGYLKPFQFFLNKPLQIPNIPLSIGGNLYLKSLESIAATAYCLDNFESSLKRSNRLLFRYQNNLLLIQATSSAILKQKCPSKWNFTSQLANGPIKNSLQDCDEIRAFLPGKKNTLLIEQYLLQAIYNAKPKLSIAAQAPAIETASHLIEMSLIVARQNEKGIKADYDSEFLHDYRVSLRKVRSVISLFKGVYSEAESISLKQKFSDIMKVTNRLRDLDVYLIDKQELFELLPEHMHFGLEQMFKAFIVERKKQLQKVTKLLSSKSYQQDIQTLQNKFRSAENLTAGSKALTASLPFASKLIWKRYRKVCQIAQKIDASTPDEEVHVLRIQCKKLRYLMEFFSSLFPKKLLKDLIKSLKRLQDNLGRFNDFSVQQESLKEFLANYTKKHRNKNLIAMAESIGALIILLQQKQSHERAQVMQSFSHFDSPEIREEFSEVFHHGINQ